MLAQSVEVHGEKEIGRGLEQMQLLLEQERVGAERDEFLLGNEALYDVRHLAMD